MVKCSECKYWSKDLGFVPGALMCAVRVSPDTPQPDPTILALAYQTHDCPDFECGVIPSPPPSTRNEQLRQLLNDRFITPTQYYDHCTQSAAIDRSECDYL